MNGNTKKKKKAANKKNKESDTNDLRSSRRVFSLPHELEGTSTGLSGQYIVHLRTRDYSLSKRKSILREVFHRNSNSDN